jgi:hypothetical protein
VRRHRMEHSLTGNFSNLCLFYGLTASTRGSDRVRLRLTESDITPQSDWTLSESAPVLCDAGRLKGAFTDKPRGGSGGRRSLMVDLLAERGEDEEALCAVCAGGHSEAPDQIVFCERCDIAVHQECYGVPLIPSGACSPSVDMRHRNLSTAVQCSVCEDPNNDTTIP